MKENKEKTLYNTDSEETTAKQGQGWINPMLRSLGKNQFYLDYLISLKLVCSGCKLNGNRNNKGKCHQFHTLNAGSEP